MSGFIEDLRYGLRALAKSRGFALVAMLSLALGIGANTTIFTFINAIFLRPLPVDDPSRLAAVFTLDPRIPGYLLCSYPNYKDYRDQNQPFSSLLLYASVVGSLTGGDAPQPVTFQIVSGNYFQTLGITPTVGRAFLPEEDATPGAYPVAVISHSLWTRQFGGDPHILGRNLPVDGHNFQIVGVAPEGFHGLNLLSPSEIWVPMMMYTQLYPDTSWVNQRRALLFTVVGRLKPGVTIQRAEAQMRSLTQELEREYPRDNEGRRPKLFPLSQSAIHPGTRSAMTASGMVLMIVAGLVLLIACGNVANLLLARAAGRNKEIAVRVALGAGRWRLIRQLLTESTVLALAGGAVGLAMAAWGRQVLWSLRPPQLDASIFRIDLDGRVLAFTFAISLLTGILFGLLPALRATRPDLATDLRDRSGPPTLGWSGRKVRSTLVAGEVALCVVALVGAGLFLRSLRSAEQVDPGFDAEHLGTVFFNVSDLGYDEVRGSEFQRRVLEKAAAVPGVASAALSRDTLFRVSLARTVLIEDDPQAGKGRVTLVSPVSANYFRTTGIPLVRGRDFSALDTPRSPRVAVINEVAATRYWPNRDPIGQRLRFFGTDYSLEVVGIARTASYIAIGEAPQALIYTAFEQDFGSTAALVVRTTGNTGAVLASVTREVQTLDPHLLLHPQAMRAVILSSLWAPRLSAGLLSIFGLLGLLLAGVGIYGVISYSVHQRTREIGVRIALGATAGDVQLMMLREVLQLVTIGVVTGLVLSVVASQAIKSLLFVTGVGDATTFILVPAVLIVVAMLACWIPVHRATHIDPMKALRDE
ncbi:MAG TPA: ABC transporter permease [Bryobacteraceae bacterium]|nr:ABC transporter permease [Bryobacteraceae bacterium]